MVVLDLICLSLFTRRFFSRMIPEMIGVQDNKLWDHFQLILKYSNGKTKLSYSRNQQFTECQQKSCVCVCVCVNTRNLLSCGPFLLFYVFIYFLTEFLGLGGITYSIKITMSVESSHKTWKVNIGLPLLNPQQWTSTVCAIHSSKCQHSLKETWITKVKGIVNHLN